MTNSLSVVKHHHKFYLPKTCQTTMTLRLIYLSISLLGLSPCLSKIRQIPQTAHTIYCASLSAKV